MDYMTIFFLVVLVCAIAFIVWLKSSKGKKWLASL
nr:MAG TPA: Translocon-associated protein beta (TRAPB) [Caudoviricetes sp.]